MDPPLIAADKLPPAFLESQVQDILIPGDP